MPLLTLLWAVPLAGAILMLLIPGAGDEPARPHDDHEVRGSRGPRDALFRNLGMVVSLVVFGLTLMLWAGFDASSAEFQFVERAAWIPAFGDRKSVV